MRLAAVVFLALASAGCGAKSELRGKDGVAADAAVGAPDAAAPADCSSSLDCPAPRVECKALPPACPPGRYPGTAPEECEGGRCEGRCWTFECLPCADECECDADCALVDRFGCCCEDPDGPDRGEARVWAMPRRALEDDPCLFAEGRPGDVPAGCPEECEMSPPGCGGECSHCPAHSARCEGGRCVPARDCEPDCLCL